MPWFVLGLSGVTNSGKTTVAAKLKEMFPNSEHIKQDEYFLPENDPRHVIVPGLGHANWEIMSSMDMDRMVDDVQRKLASDPPEIRFLILDGFLLFMDPRITAVCHLKVYMDLDYETCRARRSERTYDPPDVPGYFEQVVWPEAQAAKARMLNQDPTIIVLDGKLPTQVVLDILKKVINRLVGSEDG